MGVTYRIKIIARAAAAALLLASLFYSPWDNGGTSASAIRNLNWILGVMFGLWLVGAGVAEVRSRRPEVGGDSTASGARLKHRSPFSDLCSPTSVLLLLLSLLLLGLGWGMALNAHAIFDADYEVFLPLISPAAGAPGTVDQALSVALMWRVTTLLGCVWVMADLANDPKWLLRIWWGLGLAGGSIALLGLVQKATGAALPFWQTPEAGEGAVSTFFGPFYYHGNAGAYLNLALPAVLGLAYRYMTRRGYPFSRALWSALSVIMLVAVASDTSRMGQFLAALMVVTLLLLSAKTTLRRMRHLELRTALIALIVGGGAIWAVVQTSQLDRSLGRWDRAQASVSQDARWRADEVAWHALPKAGATGFGPGTFSAVFPHFQGGSEEVDGNWLFLHNDYLQTLLEWGWLGGLLWTGLFLGGLGTALGFLFDRQRVAEWYPRQRQFLVLALVALGGVALHAIVDFPLQISSIQLYAAVYLGVCWGAGRRPAG